MRLPIKQRAVVGAISTLLASANAQAVNIASDGLGQVLLYPYYTSRSDPIGSPFGTLLSVVNSTGLTKGVRVRFLEGKNGREVLGFNLFLSPFDTWTAAVLPNATTGGAAVGTVDFSCTLPPFSASSSAPYIQFVNTAYSGANDDGAGTGLDRSKEGYFELIEMATYDSSSATAAAVSHPLAAPPQCGTNLNDGQATTDALPPTGGLFGALTIINVNEGIEYTADAVALANFYQAGSNYHSVSSPLPDLTQASPAISSIHGLDGRLYESAWSAGSADAVSAVLMHDNIMNEYVLDTVTKSGTDWVITMPTKRFYVSSGTGNAPRLFQSNFNGPAGSCDTISFKAWDREGHVTLFNAGIPSICWQSTVGTMEGGALLGSANQISFLTFMNGWAQIGFMPSVVGASAGVHRLINVGSTTISGKAQMTTGNTITYIGLPAIGFSVISFTNGTVQVGTPPVNVLSNYGGNFMHKSTVTIQ